MAMRHCPKLASSEPGRRSQHSTNCIRMASRAAMPPHSACGVAWRQRVPTTVSGAAHRQLVVQIAFCPWHVCVGVEAKPQSHRRWPALFAGTTGCQPGGGGAGCLVVHPSTSWLWHGAHLHVMVNATGIKKHAVPPLVGALWVVHLGALGQPEDRPGPCVAPSLRQAFVPPPPPPHTSRHMTHAHGTPKEQQRLRTTT